MENIKIIEGKDSQSLSSKCPNKDKGYAVERHDKVRLETGRRNVFTRKPSLLSGLDLSWQAEQSALRPRW